MTAAFVAEFVLTMFFLLVILGATDKFANGKFAGIAIGLALLTKGPAALLLWALTLLVVGILYRSRVTGRLFTGAIVAGLLSVLFFVAWYGLIAYRFGWYFSGCIIVGLDEPDFWSFEFHFNYGWL